jgi:hypothetical protein
LDSPGKLSDNSNYNSTFFSVSYFIEDLYCEQAR